MLDVLAAVDGECGRDLRTQQKPNREGPAIGVTPHALVVPSVQGRAYVVGGRSVRPGPTRIGQHIVRHRSAEHIRRGPCCLATSQCSRRRVPPSVRVFSQASPAAKMLSTDVRRQLPHVIPPVAPIRSPAYLASMTSGTAPAGQRPFRPAAAASTPYAPWPRGLVLRTLGARRRRPTRCRAWSAAPRRSVPQEPVAALQRQRFLHHEGDALAHLGERRRELGAQTRPADDHDVIILALQRSRRIERAFPGVRRWCIRSS